MFTQLPTPLDCIRSTPRWPPAQAPASSATPSSSVVSGIRAHRGRAQHALDQLRMPGIRHIGHLTDIEALQNRKDILRPGGRSFGRNLGGGFSTGVHFHFQSVSRDCIPVRDCRGSRGFAKEQKRHIGLPKEYGSMNANARELAANFDIEKLTPEFYADPYPTYRALREHEPVKRMPNGSWFLTRYDDLVSAYKNTKLFSSDKKKEFSPKYGDSLLYEHHTTSLVFNDPPAHTRVRRLIMGALSPRAIAGMEPDLIALVDRLLDSIAAKGDVDLIDDFAAAIPIEVIGNLLDVPQAGARAAARLVAGDSGRARTGDLGRRVCPRQQGGEGFSRLSGNPGRAAARQARQSRSRRADAPDPGRGQWRAADGKGIAAQLHLPAQRRARDHHQSDRQRAGGAVGKPRAEKAADRKPESDQDRGRGNPAI